MTIRPIIFSGPMVRALLDGRKTQTRRLATSPLRKCEPGDLLYVRESIWQGVETRAGFAGSSGPDHGESWSKEIYYRADGVDYSDNKTLTSRPSIHTPRWASRLTLEVTRVRFERLQFIDEPSALDEGIRPTGAGRYFIPEFNDGYTPRAFPGEAFCDLWDRLHTKPGETWDDNPEIVALTFKVHHCNVDQMAPTTGGEHE